MENILKLAKPKGSEVKFGQSEIRMQLTDASNFSVL